MSSSNSTANSSAAAGGGESKQSSVPITGIARGVKRGDSTERNEVVPQFLIAGFTGDRSGSMQDIDEASGKGLYKWLEDTTENAVKNGQTGKIFVTTFDDRSEKVIEGEAIADVHKKITNNELDLDFCTNVMKARGTTKLFDTAITDLDNIVVSRDILFDNLPPALKKINPKIAMIWACCTDGFDNESTHTRQEFREKVLWARSKGVKCFFLAANQDAQTVGQEYGFNPDTSLTFGADVERVECAMRSVTQCMREASTGSTNYVFTQLMRQSSAPSNMTPFNSPPDNNGLNMLRQAAMLRQPAFLPPAGLRQSAAFAPPPSLLRQTNSAAAAAISSTLPAITPDTISQIGRS